MTQEAGLYHLLFEHATQGLVLLRGEKIALANQSFAHMVGYSLDDLLGISLERILSVVHPQDRDMMLARFRDRLAGREVPTYYEFRLIQRDGEVGWWATTMSLINYRGEAAVLGTFVDVTERKQAEEALQESLTRERFLGDIIRDASLAVGVGYPDGHIGMVNSAFQELTGYSEEELKTLSWNLTLTPPEWRELEAAQLSQLYRSRRAVRYEKEYIRKDGSRIPVELVVHPYLDEGGTIACYVAFVSDITGRKQAEAAQRESEATVRALLNAPTETVLMLSVDGTVLALNSTAARRLGTSSGELIGTSVWDLLSPEVGRFRKRQFAKAISSVQPVTFEDQRAGTWFETTVYPVQDVEGQVTRLAVFARDITERRQAEEALRANKQLVDSIIDTVPLGICLTDQDGCFVRVNDEYCRIFALKREDLLKKHLSVILPPGMEEVARTAYRKILSGDVEVELERVYRRGDGAVLYLDSSNTVVYDQEGAPLVVTVVRDVTALKQAEQQRIALALEQERMRILTDFIAQASHEFRTPLSVINTSTYVLKKADDPEVQQRHLSSIEAQAQSIATLVEGLMTMLRLDSSQTILNQQVDLCSLIEGVYQGKRGDLEAKRIQTRLEFKARPLIVSGDVGYLHQAIARILDNALHFTPDGGSIHVRAELVGKDAVVEISDTGSGIEQADLEHIFERFYRADKAGTTRGFGLGLPIARAIVERHQGKIEVESAPGRGSKFRVILPIS